MTIYYVSNAGTDSSNGTTELTSWKTISKVNSFAFKPGDRVRFKAGDTWSGTTLIISVSGVSGNSIYFEKYGTATALPIIIGGGDACVRINKAYISFESIDVNGNSSLSYGIVVNGNHIDIKNTIVRNTKGIGVIGWGASVTNILIDSCTFHHNTTQGCHFGADAKPGPVDVTITKCKSYSNGTSTAYDHGIYIKFGTRYRVSYNECYSNAGDGVTTNGCTDSIVEYNKCYSNNVGFSESGASGSSLNNTLRYNLCYNNYYNVAIGGTVNNAFIHHNTLVNGTNKGIEYYLTSPINGVIFKDNIVLQDASVIGEQWSAYPLDLATPSLVTNNIFDYNCYIYIGEGSKTGKIYRIQTPSADGTFSSWKNLSSRPDAHSINVDPKLTVDYKLQTGSPCIGKASDGGDMGAFPSGVTPPPVDPPPGPTPEEQIKEEFKKMSESLDLLSAQVAATIGVIAKAVPIVLSFNDKLDAVIAELEAAKIDTVALQKLSVDLKTATQPLADIVAANP